MLPLAVSLVTVALISNVLRIWSRGVKPFGVRHAPPLIAPSSQCVCVVISVNEPASAVPVIRQLNHSANVGGAEVITAVSALSDCVMRIVPRVTCPTSTCLMAPTQSPPLTFTSVEE